MQAKDIMTTNIVTVKREATLKESVQLCVDEEASGLIVVNDQEEIVGVLSEKDLLVAFDFLGDTKSSIREFMSSDVVSIQEDTPIKEISFTLIQRNFKRVPVVKDNKVIGIVSRRDILKWISQQDG